ncbi:MAG: MBL fold metallo-hydrolase [Burkholderiaceae bacterium]|nr:MBL fold metallo-hydrolase [Burkholderiaceae bacterium]
MSKPTERRGSILDIAFEPTTVADGVHLVATQGNGVVIETGDGLVLVDAGAGGELTDRMIADVRGISDAPVRAIIYSHGHIGYNAGVPQWQAHAAERGDPMPWLVAQANARQRFDRYRRTFGMQLLLNSWQFQKATRESLVQGLSFVDPTHVFETALMLEDPDRPVEVFAAPSETDDCVGLWLPRQEILYGGPAVINGFPNVGTPLRSQRRTQRWVDTLDAMIARKARILIPEFGPAVVGADAVRHRLQTTADALRWLIDEVTERMNRGLNDVEILHDLPDPGERFAHEHLKSNYGSPDYVVRDLFREQSGWWTSRNPTDLHPAAPDAAATAILAAVDPARVIAAARAHAESGEHQLALHVIDLLAMAPGNDPLLAEARELKAACCDALSRQTAPFVSRSLYRGSARLLRAGKRGWSEAPDGLDALD